MAKWDGRAFLLAADPALGAAITAVGPYALIPEPLTSVYEALIRSIVYQQLTGKAAATIHARLAALGCAGVPDADEVAGLSDEQLRGVGLSGAKVRALQDLALRQRSGLLPGVEEAASLDDDALIERLSAVRGIGVWSVQMLMMFRLHRPDVLPATDLGIQKGLQRVLGLSELPTAKAVLAHGARWAPHRTMASWYLWRVLELPSAAFLATP